MAEPRNHVWRATRSGSSRRRGRRGTPPRRCGGSGRSRPWRGRACSCRASTPRRCPRGRGSCPRATPCRRPGACPPGRRRRRCSRSRRRGRSGLPRCSRPRRRSAWCCPRASCARPRRSPPTSTAPRSEGLPDGLAVVLGLLPVDHVDGVLGLVRVHDPLGERAGQRAACLRDALRVGGDGHRRARHAEGPGEHDLVRRVGDAVPRVVLRARFRSRSARSRGPSRTRPGPWRGRRPRPQGTRARSALLRRRTSRCRGRWRPAWPRRPRPGSERRCGRRTRCRPRACPRTDPEGRRPARGREAAPRTRFRRGARAGGVMGLGLFAAAAREGGEHHGDDRQAGKRHRMVLGARGYGGGGGWSNNVHLSGCRSLEPLARARFQARELRMLAGRLEERP